MTTRISLVWLLMFGAIAGMAQSLTSTFSFTASGYLGTPATATSPFQGQTFTNASVTITAIGNTTNRTYDSNNYCIQNDSATVTISGLGTYRFPYSALHSQAQIDPVKGITGDTIGLWVSENGPYPFCNAAFPNVDVFIQRSSLWDMTSSLGPTQVTNSNYTGLAMPTSGGTLQFSPSGLSVTMGFQAVFTGAPPAPTLTRSGVLSHVAAGGGWTTVMTLVNPSSTAVPVQVALHGDDGGALTLPITTTQQGISQKTTTSSVSATINPNATLLISTGDQVASTVVGWADVLSTGSLGGFAIFQQTPPTGSSSEGTVPLQSQSPSIVTLPYDNTAGFVMGIALANLSTSLASVTITMWDDLGNQLGTQNLTIAGSGHTAFVLPTQFPLTVGKRGIVKFQAIGGLAGLGLRFSPFGTFTSVPTL
jgi:hypothetical protein